MACIKSNDIYFLINVKSNTCLDLSGGDNRSIIGYDFHKGPNQSWIFEKVGGGFYIKSVSSAQFLGIAGEPQDGQMVIASPSPFEWHVVDEPGVNKAVRLFVPGTRFNVDLSDNGNKAPGTPVTLWGKWGGENQLWRLEKQ
ncbi:carbohydrate-binding module family 13 protein [Hydnomerulius pinastri MD-312]|uniref:Carbohydrate-binding module family 13 protein n=1 Tax=Hydnomerulius pinastri MD-312 TaxID=994086 RepID=A0A0C9VJP3_9AGAM|nr:carbohydrate-binding module family 13 protein [Hydnomerulius pinastri MD-312]